MKVILDTNVFVSGVFFSGPPYQILKAWKERKLKLVLSSEIFDEYRRVALLLADQFPPVNLEDILELVEKEAKSYDAPALSEQVCDDPDDTNLLPALLQAIQKSL